MLTLGEISRSAEKDTDLLDTPFEFVKWVYSKGVDDLIGVSCNAKRCPISLFLKEKGVYKQTPWVFYNYRTQDIVLGPLSYNAPWVTEFINDYDRFFPTGHFTKGGEMINFINKFIESYGI